MDMLNRSHAPFDAELWNAIDEAASESAAAMLTGRRLLETEGPYGSGLTSIEVGNDDYCRTVGANEAGAVVSRAVSVPMLRKSFKISIRRLMAAAENSQPLNLSPVEDAAEAVARREDEFIYYGNKDFGLEGLLTARGRNTLTAGDWSKVDQALEDVVKAVTLLDDGGFPGPYGMALSPALYNQLFRRYEGSDLLQLEHLKRVCTAGIFKAPIKGGVIVDARVGPIVLGQDLMAGYIGQDGIHHEFFLSSSMVLRLDDPEAICALDPKAS